MPPERKPADNAVEWLNRAQSDLTLAGNRIEASGHKSQVPVSKLASGSVTNKYPVLLDDGKTMDDYNYMQVA